MCNYDTRTILKDFKKDFNSVKNEMKEIVPKYQFCKKFKKKFYKILFMICKDINSINIVVQTIKLLITYEKNVSFFIIDFENEKWLNIDSNNNLNKIVNDKHKRLEKTIVAILLSNLTFMKLTRNVELLSSFITLKQIIYLKVENCFPESRM